MNDVTDQLASKLEDRINQCLDDKDDPERENVVGSTTEREIGFSTTTDRPELFKGSESAREDHLDEHLSKALQYIVAPVDEEEEVSAEVELVPVDPESDVNDIHEIKTTIRIT